MKLNQKAVTGLTVPRGRHEHIEWDEDLPSFGVRIRKGGSRTWVVQFRVGMKQRRLSLGSVHLLDATTARQRARDVLAAVRLGRDPAGEKAEGRARASETVGAALQSYLARQKSRLKPRSYTENERHLMQHCRPLHGLQLGKVDRRAIATRMTVVAARSGTVTANRVRASLSAFFAWGIREGLIDQNPVIGTGRNAERARERVLAPEELKIIWLAAGDGDYGACLRLLILTGQRLNEIAGLQWSEVKDDHIALSADRVKNRRAHIVPLSAPAKAILASRSHRPDSDQVFHGRRGSLSGWTELRARLDARIEATGAQLPTWVHHDIRHSFSTHLAEKLGIQPHIIEAVLNHVSGHKAGVAGIYNRASYEAEKRQALTMWGEYLIDLIEGRKATVVPLRA